MTSVTTERSCDRWNEFVAVGKLCSPNGTVAAIVRSDRSRGRSYMINRHYRSGGQRRRRNADIYTLMVMKVIDNVILGVMPYNSAITVACNVASYDGFYNISTLMLFSV